MFIGISSRHQLSAWVVTGTSCNQQRSREGCRSFMNIHLVFATDLNYLLALLSRCTQDAFVCLMIFFFENKFIFILFAVISVGWSAEPIKLNFLNCFFYYNLQLNKMLAFRLSNSNKTVDSPLITDVAMLLDAWFSLKTFQSFSFPTNIVHN